MTRNQAMAAWVAVSLSLTLVACGADTGDGRRTATESGRDEPAPAVTEPAGPGKQHRARTVTPGGSPSPTPARATATPDEQPLAGTEDWRVQRSGLGRIAAYSTRPGGPPGTRVGLKVSTGAETFRVIAHRIGAYDGGTGREVWRSRYLPGRQQAAPVLRPASTRTVVAPWTRDLSVDTTGWTPGFYVFEVRTGQGFEVLVPYVVSSRSAAGTVALVAPVTTWQAYNAWGGYSLYEGPEGDRRSYAVSFDRPYNGATGANDFRTAAIPIVVRAEQLGIPLSYFTNVDLHTTPGVLDGARGYVSMGHDEYWTTTMRLAVTEARDAGTNLAFLGANTMYWRIRLQDTATGTARTVVGYRDAAWADPVRGSRPHETTARFRDAPAPDPEHSLIGMMYECYPVDADYVVASPDWWGFRGTGVRAGDRIPGLVGPEADRVYPGPGLPRPLQILSRTPYSCRGVGTVAESVYYTAPSGAGVFAAGTLRWGCALVDACDHPLGQVTRDFVHAVTGTVLREFAEGPAGRRHPARDNVARFDPSALNTVSAS